MDNGSAMTQTYIDKISTATDPYVIAEVGINHNGDLALAHEMIAAAKESGAHAVKFQNFICDEYLSPVAPKAGYQANADDSGKSQYELIKACEINADDTVALRAYAEELDIDFLSTPFERTSLHMLLDMGLDAIKVSSCNLTNYPFLQDLANSGVPALLSSGMGDLAEVIRAVEIFKACGSPLLLFQCTSNYPSKIENANVTVIDAYKTLFDVPVGFSDHTPDNTAAIVAVARGAVCVEKHFTLSRDLPGIDQKASIEPSELAELVRVLADARRALGNPLKIRTGEEDDTSAALRRSLIADIDLQPGDVLSLENIAIKRPGTGLPVHFLDQLVGRTLTRAVKKNNPLSLDDFLS